MDLERVRWGKIILGRVEFQECILTMCFVFCFGFGFFLWVRRSWASSTRCTERSCSWLCRPSAQRRRITRESWTITGWQVSTIRCYKIWAVLTMLWFLLCVLPFPSGWLDDIGLPQYKTQFDEGRVDGRMLHYMTVVSVWHDTPDLERSGRRVGLKIPLPFCIRIRTLSNSTGDVIHSWTPHCLALWLIYTDLFAREFYPPKLFWFGHKLECLILTFVFFFVFFWESHCLFLSLRMTCFLWKWEVFCITSVSRELSKYSDLTTMSPTVYVAGHQMRWIIWKWFLQAF